MKTLNLPDRIVTIDEAEEVDRVVDEFLREYDVPLWDSEELFLCWGVYSRDPSDPLDLTAGQLALAEAVLWSRYERAVGRT